MVALPIGFGVLLVFLMPITPLFILRRGSQALWNIQISVSESKIKLIHFIVIMFLLLFLNQCMSMAKLEEANDEHPENALEIDFKLRRNKTERDFYLYAQVLMVWVYIWRLCPLIYEQSQWLELENQALKEKQS